MVAGKTNSRCRSPGAAKKGKSRKVRSGNELVTVETDDPDVEVVMRRNGDLVRVLDTKTKKSWELDAMEPDYLAGQGAAAGSPRGTFAA